MHCRNYKWARALLRRVGRHCMANSVDYQRFAEECVEIARGVKDNQAKAALIHMAQVWLRLAAKLKSEIEEETV